jgi:replication factor C small subunit
LGQKWEDTTPAFYGPPGVGKTSTAIALGRDLLGKEWKENVHIYNASDSRGIDFIRDNIKTIVRTVPAGAAFQIVFLDEADELTHSAQTALREIMQRHTDTAKFIFSCNCPENIIDPIKDRCAEFKFYRIQPDVITEKLKIVCAKEQIGFEGNALEIIAKNSGGSLRKAIQYLEVYRDSNNYISLDNITTLENFRTQIISQEIQGIEQLLQKAFAGDVEEYEKQLDILFDGGLFAKEMLSMILDSVSNDKNIEIPLKQALINQTGQYEWRISQGANEILQMRCFLNTLHMTFAKYNRTS